MIVWILIVLWVIVASAILMCPFIDPGKDEYEMSDEEWECLKHIYDKD